jgi:hypothetical protein
MTINLNMAIGQGYQGMTMTSGQSGMLLEALVGGQETTSLVQQGWNLADGYRQAASSGFQIQYDQNGIPSATTSGGPISMTVQTQLNQAVISGQTPPTGFQYNGQTYNIVGMLTTTVGYEEQPVWYYEVPIGVVSSFAAAGFGSLAWSNLIKPIFQNFVQSVQNLLSASVEADSQAAVSEAATEAAADASIDAEEIGEVVLNLDVGVGSLISFGMAVALPFLLGMLFHESYHNLSVYNLTSYDLVWQPRILGKDEGTFVMYPVTGADSTTPETVIPAMRSFAPPGIVPVPVATQANFSVVSDTKINGIDYAIDFEICQANTQNPGGPSVATQFSIPLLSPNGLCVPGATEYPPSRASMSYGATLMNGNPLAVSITFDYLSGEHPTPNNGPNAYMYNSIAVFWENQPSA